MGEQLKFNIYGYVPSRAVGYAMVILFAVLTLLHIGLTFWRLSWRTRKHMFLIVTAIGGLGEIIGWGGRLWASYSYRSMDAFLIQEVALIVTPVFFSAVVYCIFGCLIPLISLRESPLRPSLYAAIFVTMDVICLAVQGAGGGMAGGALADGKSSVTGTHIMLAGIVAQLVSMLVFTVLVAVYCWRTRRHPALVTAEIGARHKRIVLASAMLATLCLVVRAIYRTFELAQGWEGYLITHEGYFVGFDAVMCLLCMLILAIGHPAIWRYALIPSEAAAALPPESDSVKALGNEASLEGTSEHTGEEKENSIV